MPYWCAAFGPNDSYFFNSPLKWSMCGLPDRINTLFNTGPKAKEIHEIALGPNGSYAIIFTDQTGIKVRHSGLPQPVEQWLLNHSGRAINSARDLASMQISLGPKGSYFAFDKNGCIWGNLPPALEAAVNERRNMNGYFKPGAYPYLVSLGAAGTYAMFTVGGGGSWYFGGQKNELDQYLHGLSSLMHVGVILSPFNIDHFLMVTGQGVTAGVAPDVAAAAYKAFSEDWRLSIEAETIPPPPPGGPPSSQTVVPPQLPPRRPSSVAEDAQRHSYVPYTPPNEVRPSLPPRPFSDTTAETIHYTPYSPAIQNAPQFQPPPSPNPSAYSPPTQAPPTFAPPPIQRRPVSQNLSPKAQANPDSLSPHLSQPPTIDTNPTFPPPPPYTPTATAPPPPKDMKPQVTSPQKPIFAPPPTTQPPKPQPTPAITAQAAAANAQAQAQAKAAAKAKRDQRIKAGIKMGKMAMHGLAIGAAIINIASGNGGDIPSFGDGGGGGGGDVPLPAPDVPAETFDWQPLQDCASMPIQ